jgi:hypothetical protein
VPMHSRRRVSFAALVVGLAGAGACAERTTSPNAALAPSTTASASAFPAAVAGGSASQDAGCGVEAYQPAPAWSGRPSALAPPPTLPDSPQRVGDAYTVAGALHALSSRFGGAALAKDITIVGVIVDTNVARAPKCALHRTGVADPPGCVTEIPTFSIADAPGAPPAGRIPVMGWASNFAQVFEARLGYQAHPPKKPYIDELWGVELPYPLPTVGAKVKVTGRYAVHFTRSSTGLVADPTHGILTFTKAEYVP